MIEAISILRNVGNFDSFDNRINNNFDKLALIYAENGRGKSTLATIMRSVSTGDPGPIAERRRLGSTQPPQVVLTRPDGTVAFQNNSWNRQVTEMVVFDERFVEDNVCSGMEIEPAHRRNLHELVLGAEGVSLNAATQEKIREIDGLNRELRELEDSIPAAARYGLGIEAFCNLPSLEGVDAAIEETERRLNSVRRATSIRDQPPFPEVTLPSFELEALESLLSRGLAELQAAANHQLQAHFQQLGADGEAWVRDGYGRLSTDAAESSCPFCAQPLRESSLIAHYQAYFSEAYDQLKRDIRSRLQQLDTTHGPMARTAFETAVRDAQSAQRFWAEHLTVPSVDIDAPAVLDAWRRAYEDLRAALKEKERAPLEAVAVSSQLRGQIEAFEQTRGLVARENAAFREVQTEIDKLKSDTADQDPASLEQQLRTLQATKSRYTPGIAEVCDSHLKTQQAKKTAEEERDAARERLASYRNDVFPAYEEAINAYLEAFNAGFRLNSIAAANDGRGSLCNYSLVINAEQVAVAAARATGPSFRNTLSTGDRSTLALAFFFAALDRNPHKSDCVVVIDDPMTSLDEHRSLATVRQIRKLVDEVAQVIVLSHSKRFLCALWEEAPKQERSACQLTHLGDGSTFAPWDVNDDLITEHDRRYELVDNYIRDGSSVPEREAAVALRYILETFARVAYPRLCPPGTLLGRFINACERALASGEPALSTDDLEELRALKDYANLFHHDTNPSQYRSVLINSAELRDYCRRTLRFTRR